MEALSIPYSSVIISSNALLTCSTSSGCGHFFLHDEQRANDTNFWRNSVGPPLLKVLKNEENKETLMSREKNS